MSMDDDNAAAAETSSGAAPPREQGAALMRMGRMAEAVAALERAVADDANDEQSWRLLGGALSARGDQAGAVRAFQQSARLAPASPKSHYNLAVALQATGQLYEAKSHLDQALALNPNYEQARALLDELARQADTRGSGMAQPTGGGGDALTPAPPPQRPAAYTPAPAASSGSDDLAPVGGPAAFGGGMGTVGGGTAVGGRSAGGDDLASVGNSSGYSSAPLPPPPGGAVLRPPSDAGTTGVPNLGPSPYGGAAAYAPTPVLGQVYGQAVNNSGAQGAVPAELSGGWNWGAFYFSWIWLFNHKMAGLAAGMLVFSILSAVIPFVGFLGLPVAIWLGVSGNKMAWQNRRWNSVEDCKACQRIWAFWVLGVFLGVFVLAIIAAILFPVFAQALRAAGGG